MQRSPALLAAVLAGLGLGQAAYPMGQAHATEPAPALPALPAQPAFTVASRYALDVGRGSGTVVLADVSGDSHLDLLTRFLLSRTVAVHLGDGRGGFTAATGSPLQFDYEPAAMELADLDGDGRVDVAVAPAYQDAVDVLLGLGDGRFRRAPGSPFTAATPFTRMSKRTLHVRQLNGDAFLDVITANGRNGTFVAFLGDGTGRLVALPATVFDPGSNNDFRSLAFNDVSGDGIVDAVISTSGQPGGRGPGRVEIFRGDGTGAFAHGGALDGVPAGRVWLGDVGGGPQKDLVIAHDGGSVTVYLNTGTTTPFSWPATAAFEIPNAWDVTTVDVNRDGRNDLLAATVDSVTVLLATDTGFVRAAGSPYPAGPGAYHLAAGDVNEDGRVDIVAASFEGDRLRVLLQGAP